MITCGSQAMAEPLLPALLPIANDRMRGAALKRVNEDTLRQPLAEPERGRAQREIRGDDAYVTENQLCNAEYFLHVGCPRTDSQKLSFERLPCC